MKSFTKTLNNLLKNRVFLMVLTFVLLFILWKCVSTIEGLTNGSESVFDQSEVPSSIPSTFMEDLGDSPKLVWFYADWCGHCKKMLEDWDKLALGEGSGKMIKINVGEQGNSEQEHIASQYNVTAYPTILVINGSEFEEFEGERNYSGLRLGLP